MPKLSDLGTLKSGFHLRGAAEAQPDGRQTVIQLGDVREGAVNFDRVIRMNLDRARPKDFLEPGDMLLRSRGASYGAAVVASCAPETLAAAPLYVLRLVPGLRPEFVAWYINRPGAQSALEARASGTHIATVSLEAFSDLPIVLPSGSKQHRILEMEDLFQQEKDLAAKYMKRRGQLVQAAQEAILGDTQ